MRWILPVVVACSSASAAPKPEYQAHIDALKARLAKLGLKTTIRIEEPFVVVGDGSADALAKGAATVRWAADRLEADFFGKRPTAILDVYLFHDAASYERGVKLLTGSAPDTPYGFYSHQHGGLFMNIATGGGTLVHEIVHPYVEADFPDAPPWLNEGLGSLFEQSAERDGHIIGLTNWRLEGLQTALAAGPIPSFAALAKLDTDAFYDDDKGIHYAEARYLLYYLQQRGLLRDFYRAFRAAHDKDPSGVATLTATVGDLGKLQPQWQRWVAQLHFP